MQSFGNIVASGVAGLLWTVVSSTTASIYLEAWALIFLRGIGEDCAAPFYFQLKLMMDVDAMSGHFALRAKPNGEAAHCRNTNRLVRRNG